MAAKTSGTKAWQTLLHDPLVNAVIYYMIVFILCRLGRLFAQRVWKSGWPSRLALDFFAGLQAVLHNIENGIVYKAAAASTTYNPYATYIYALTIFLGGIICMIEQGVGNPCGVLKKKLTRKITLSDAIRSLTAYVVVGLSALPLAKLLHSASFCPVHLEHAKTLTCVIKLKVPMTSGFLCEFLGAFGKEVIKSATTANLPAVAVLPIVSAATVVAKLSGRHQTGMYINPLAAVATQFRCKGFNHIDHFTVYWLGPMIATAVVVGLEKKGFFGRKAKKA